VSDLDTFGKIIRGCGFGAILWAHIAVGVIMYIYGIAVWKVVVALLVSITFWCLAIWWLFVIGGKNDFSRSKDVPTEEG
jgi:hypothetical protein